MFKKLKKTIIIAEACENHFGDIDNAKKMITLSKNSGACSPHCGQLTKSTFDTSKHF